MTVQVGLCRTCSETTLLVFPRDGSYYAKKSLSLIIIMTQSAFCLSCTEAKTGNLMSLLNHLIKYNYENIFVVLYLNKYRVYEYKNSFLSRYALIF